MNYAKRFGSLKAGYQRDLRLFGLNALREGVLALGGLMDPGNL